MADWAALDELNRLIDADAAESDAGTEVVHTALRLSAPLRAAVTLAVEHFGAAPSVVAMAPSTLRRHLETLALEAALHVHCREHRKARPSLAEIAHALAVQDGSPLAQRPDLLAAAASAVVERHPTADADDVLLWAQAQLAATS
jgi:hypothetical protein